VLVPHDEHLEVWLCQDQTVYRLEGGKPKQQQYKAAVKTNLHVIDRTGNQVATR